MPSADARFVRSPQPVWRYDPVAARGVTATLFLAAGAIGLVSAALPGWPGSRPTVIVVLSVVAMACGVVLRRLSEVPYRLALVLTGSGNVMIALAEYAGGRDGGAVAYAALSAVALAAVFLFYSPRVVVAQAVLAVSAQLTALLLTGAGWTAPAIVLLSIGSACATGLVIRSQAGQRAQAEQVLAWQASHDGLTGLPNRRELARHWQDAQRSGDDTSVLVLDMRGFKKINDEHGHQHGDAVLVEVGSRLGGLAEPAAAVRLGGDEFAVLLPGVGAGEAYRWGIRVAELLHGTHQVGDVRLPLRATVGVATHRAGGPVPPGSTSTRMRDDGGLSAVLAAADAAMYRARRLGRAVAAAEDAPDDPTAGANSAGTNGADVVAAQRG